MARFQRDRVCFTGVSIFCTVTRSSACPQSVRCKRWWKMHEINQWREVSKGERESSRASLWSTPQTLAL
jgi:hypothetical protein